MTAGSRAPLGTLSVGELPTRALSAHAQAIEKPHVGHEGTVTGTGEPRLGLAERKRGVFSRGRWRSAELWGNGPGSRPFAGVVTPVTPSFPVPPIIEI